MRQPILIALLATLIYASTPLALAQESIPKIKPVPIQPTSPASGEQMYATYCAVCHGTKGTGNGPAAPAIKFPPPDLTMLSQNHGGNFPAAHVNTVLQFGVETP